MRTRIGIGLIWLAVSGQSSPAASSTNAGSFCARLANAIGIAEPGSTNGRTTWTASPMSLGKRLFGGSVATSVNVSPVEIRSIEDVTRLSGMCKQEGKGAVCRLSGPVNFHLTWKGQQTVTPVIAGETAVVSVFGTKTSCESDSVVQAEIAISPEATSSESIAKDLSTLAELKKRGVLSESEFQAAKDKLLSTPSRDKVF